MPKSRIHELAKELGVPSKAILAWLRDNGEHARSASTTVERPVAKRIREAFAGSAIRSSKGSLPKSPEVRQAPKAPEVRQLPKSPEVPKPRTVYITSPKNLHRQRDLAPLCREYREAYAAVGHDVAIEQAYAKYTALPGVSRELVYSRIMQERRKRRQLYKFLDATRVETASVNPKGNTAIQPPDQSDVGESLPRARQVGLPPLAAGINLADLTQAMTAGTITVRNFNVDVGADLAIFESTPAGGYGYLAWSYDAVRRVVNPEYLSDDSSGLSSLAVVARVIADTKRLVGQVVESSGDFLIDRDRARRAMDAEFRALFESGDLRRSAADELRRSRAKSRFLRRAFMMTIANPDQADRLWGMLELLRPPPLERLAEESAPLLAAISRLNDEISAVALILSADEESLERFLRRSRTELESLRAGKFDYLEQFADDGVWMPAVGSHSTDTLAFAVLESGEQLRNFLTKLHSTRSYRGYDVDVQRLRVLEDLQHRYGADRCRWFEGSVSSDGVNNQYLVLAIRIADDGHEHAVAISPLAGQHATFVVRGDCCEEHWISIFANTKVEATRRGARRLLFRGDDPYATMFDKIVSLIECDAGDFTKAASA